MPLLYGELFPDKLLFNMAGALLSGMLHTAACFLHLEGCGVDTRPATVLTYSESGLVEFTAFDCLLSLKSQSNPEISRSCTLCVHDKVGTMRVPPAFRVTQALFRGL